MATGTSESSHRRRNADGTVAEPDFSLQYGDKELQHPSLLRNMGKSTTLGMILLVPFVLAAIWLSKGVEWAYDADTGTSPVFSCPALVSYSAFVDASYCQVTLLPWSAAIYYSLLQNGRYAPTHEAAKAAGVCYLPAIDMDVGPYVSQTAITCYSRQSCAETTDWYPVEPYSRASLAAHSSQRTCALVVAGMRFSVDCFQINKAEAYCNSGFDLKPNAMVAIRGIFAGILLLLVFLFANDLYVWTKAGRLRAAIRQYRTSILSLTIAEKRRELMQRCLLKWNSVISRSVSGISATASNTSGASPRALPFQPVLSPRTSVAFRSSPRGYSPRTDSPPASVISTINKSAARLSRSNGAVEVMFASSWRKRVAAYFRLRAKSLATVTLSNERTVLHWSLLIIFLVGVYVLVFEGLMILMSTPWITSMPGGVSFGDLLALPADDLTESIPSVVASDLVGDNVYKRPVLLMWIEFIAFFDVLLEAALLMILAFIAFLRPSRTSPRRSSKRIGEIEDLFPVGQKPVSEPSTAKSAMNRFGMPFPDLNDADSPASNVSLDHPSVPQQAAAALPRLSLRRGSLASMESQAGDWACDSAVCVMMSVSAPCSTAAGTAAFVEKLKSLVALVGSDADVFVIDCGRAKAPIDDTEHVIYNQVSAGIHYAYFPEPNRLTALYWLSKYWIPFQFASNLCGDYIYALLVDESVVFPKNFKLPKTEFLLNNPMIKAMYIPVDEPVLTGFAEKLSERIRLLWLSNLTGSTMHAGGHGTPQLWERNSFEMTCFNLKATNDDEVDRVLSLEANGRMLLKDRCQSRMTHWLPENGAKPKRAFHHWDGVKRDVAIRSILREAFDPSVLFHLVSFLSALPIVLIDVVSIFYDTFRIFLLAIMLLRDPIGLGIVAVITGIVTVVPLLINLLVSFKYENRRLGKLAFLLTLQPFYATLVAIPVRTVRFFKLKVIQILFRKYESDVTIGEREEEFRDLPIVPPHPVPHWSTVWT